MQEDIQALMLGKRWQNRAVSNVEKWGNQRPDTLLLALIEEVGEVAMAMEANSEPIYHATPPGADDVPGAVGYRLIREMATLGRETRNFLEGEYSDPAGDGEGSEEHRIYGELTDPERVLEEVEDTAPLCWQLYWALQESQSKPAHRPEDGGVVSEFGDRLQGAAATMAGEADELAARRPHRDAHLYDVEEGLRFRSEQLDEWLDGNY